MARYAPPQLTGNGFGDHRPLVEVLLVPPHESTGSLDGFRLLRHRRGEPSLVSRKRRRRFLDGFGQLMGCASVHLGGSRGCGSSPEEEGGGGDGGGAAEGLERGFARSLVEGHDSDGIDAER